MPSPLEIIQSRAASAVHLVAAPGASGFSRLGGLPTLPPGTEWPQWDGVPLGFLAQIDLAELPAGAAGIDLPDHGCLWFFYEAEQAPWGFDPNDAGSWRVLYAPRPAGDARVAPPEPVPENSEFSEVPLAIRPIQVLPSTERVFPEDASLDDDALDAIDRARRAPFGNRPHHQVGGYPEPQQRDAMALECQLASNGLFCGDETGYNDPRATSLAQDADAWRLLLQLDTDDDAGMMWGDCGMLYFWIRTDDLARRDFSKVWMILQCG